ncbi:MAG: hypothetical protein A2X05_01660 [Bacteroidetes bacterium GWE2_41_25]|nr:MAG: hypothetical protein A2X03_03400 [Bacteroidetes bacterium GWA2_40_15]OFX98032.1 MAG: hypothetical protein A2X06_11980 [Bacteroidetes bacterium GWC2_40_22]OFY09780.1 MAG: hypothetical protein A2X05_01660 [Bacteroidetes bacterium GWE2_41_25]HBH83725.1 hypothetical protein [Bacteroidales bacterium]HCU20784.1 hypothetical protein [Bacteroidales bacterium]
MKLLMKEIKMKHLKNIVLLSALVGVCLGFISVKSPNQPIFGNIEKEYLLSKSFNFYPQEKDTSKWVAPAEADNLKNPIDVNEKTLTEGSTIYKINCRSCHGRLGDGKGVEAADLSTLSTNFTDPSFVKQSDGSMFWKISHGRNDMKPMNVVLSEKEIWTVINFIKTFSQPSKE